MEVGVAKKFGYSFASGEYETWAACQVLLPHSKIILSDLSYDENEIKMKC